MPEASLSSDRTQPRSAATGVDHYELTEHLADGPQAVWRHWAMIPAGFIGLVPAILMLSVVLR
jgi:hypothetical protein